ncbi:MAG: hypothetical protein U0228_32985 [Myxococcaceae bacterium]
MRRLLALGAFSLVVLLALAGAVIATRVVRGATPYPCISTSKSGWLTTVSSGLLLRVEWSESGGQVAIGAENAPVRWKEIGSEAARATANEVLKPMSSGAHAPGSSQVSLYVVCDGTGDYWKGSNEDAVPWRACLRPTGETRVDCLKRAYASRFSAERVASGINARVEAIAGQNGVPLPPRSPSYALPPFAPVLPIGPGGFDDGDDGEELLE